MHRKITGNFLPCRLSAAQLVAPRSTLELIVPTGMESVVYFRELSNPSTSSHRNAHWELYEYILKGRLHVCIDSTRWRPCWSALCLPLARLQWVRSATVNRTAAAVITTAAAVIVRRRPAGSRRLVRSGRSQMRTRPHGPL